MGWSAPGAPALPPPLLPLPLVQADGTKSIMYKDVKRNGSEMADGVRMNGEGGGGLAGGRGEEEQWARGAVEEGPKRRWEPRQKRTRKDRRLRSTGEMNPARIVSAPYNVQSSRAGFSDAARCGVTACVPIGGRTRARVRYPRALCARGVKHVPCTVLRKLRCRMPFGEKSTFKRIL